MRPSIIVTLALALGLSAPALLRSVHAEGTPAPTPQGKSVTESAGTLSSDATQTKKDAQSLDVDKTAKGAGQVKQDAKDLHQSAKETLKNPLSATGK